MIASRGGRALAVAVLLWTPAAFAEQKAQAIDTLIIEHVTGQPYAVVLAKEPLELDPANRNAVEQLKELGAPPAVEDPASPAAVASDDVSSPERIVAALYEVISGPAGKARDWERFRRLFAPGARLVPAAPRRDGAAPAALSPDDYVARTSDAFTKNGFFEREIARRVEAFGTIAHVFSTYESRRALDAEPFARGINSIQLMQHDGRWWIVTVMWDQERDGTPVPAEYLPGGRR